LQRPQLIDVTLRDGLLRLFLAQFGLCLRETLQQRTRPSIGVEAALGGMVGGEWLGGQQLYG
jgi:hypothetical protein